MKLGPFQINLIRGRGDLETKANPTGVAISAQSVGQPVWTDRNYAKLSREGYVMNAVGFRCVKLISNSAATVPWLLTRKNGDAIDEHDLLNLLNRPAPGVGGHALFEAYYAYLLLNGNSYIVGSTLSTNRPPVELWNMRPDRTQIIAGSHAMPEAFRYEANGMRVDFPVDSITGKSDVLHVKEFNPLNDWYGLSRIEAAAYGIDRHNAASAHNKALLDNGARPSGMLVFEPTTVNGQSKSAPKEVVQMAREELNDTHVGPKAAGKPMLFSGNIKWQEMGISPKDMDFASGKEDAARDICYAFGVPDILIVPGQSTYNNVAEAKLDLWEQTILPLMDLTLDALNPWLVDRFGDDLKLSYDLDEISALEPRRKAKRDSIMELHKERIITTQEAREALQYGAIEQGEVTLIRGDGQTLTALVDAANADPAMLEPLYRWLVEMGLLDGAKTPMDKFIGEWDGKPSMSMEEALAAMANQPGGTASGSVPGANQPPSGTHPPGKPVPPQPGKPGKNPVPPQLAKPGKSPVPPQPGKKSHERTLFAYRPLLNVQDVKAWAVKNDIPLLPDHELHVTIAYSKGMVDWNKIPQRNDTLMIPNNSTGRLLSLFGQDGGPDPKAMVLEFASDALDSRARDFRVNGATFDYKQYRPHLTLTYQDLPNLKKIKPYVGPLVFGPEVYSEIDPAAQDRLIAAQ